MKHYMALLFSLASLTIYSSDQKSIDHHYYNVNDDFEDDENDYDPRNSRLPKKSALALARFEETFYVNGNHQTPRAAKRDARYKRENLSTRRSANLEEEETEKAVSPSIVRKRGEQRALAIAARKSSDAKCYTTN